MCRLLIGLILLHTNFVSFDVCYAQASIDNPVVPGANLGAFQHGTFPSLGNVTHAGVDLVAPCGTNILALAPGRVIDVVSTESDRDFASLGYMAIVGHAESLGNFAYHTMYLHMEVPPSVAIGNPVQAGQVLGRVGRTGSAQGCHTHFEIRHFKNRFSAWGNIYGPGDQRASAYFLQNWEDPMELFRIPDAVRNLSDVPLIESVQTGRWSGDWTSGAHEESQWRAIVTWTGGREGCHQLYVQWLDPDSSSIMRTITISEVVCGQVYIHDLQFLSSPGFNGGKPYLQLYFNTRPFMKVLLGEVGEYRIVPN